MELAGSVTILGNDVPLSELKADVQSAKDKGLSQRWAFCPETVEALIAAVESLTAEKEATEREVAKDIKQIAVDFFYWWHNQPGNNTAEGFDRWWATVAQYHKDALHGIHCLQSSLAQAREEIERLRIEKLEVIADKLVLEGLCKHLRTRMSGDEVNLSFEQKEALWQFFCEEYKKDAEAAEQREQGLREALVDMFDPLQHRVACQKRLMDKCMCAACITERAKAALRTALLDPETIKAEVAAERAALAAVSKEGV